MNPPQLDGQVVVAALCVAGWLLVAIAGLVSNWILRTPRGEGGMMERVQEVPTRFRTSDGNEYPTKEEAEKHEALIEAEADFERAKRRFGYALAETQETADGLAFKWSNPRDYWRVHWPYGAPPRLERVEYLGLGDTEVRRDGEHVEIVKRTYRDGSYDYRTYRISELYGSESAAKEARNELVAKWFSDFLVDHPDMSETLKATLATPEAPHD